MTDKQINELQRDWPHPKDFKRSMRVQISLYVSAMILLLMLITGYVVTDRYVETVTINLVEKLLMQARAYSGPSGKLLISSDALLLNNICKKMASENTEVFWVGITDQSNTFLAHTNLKEVISGKRMKTVLSNKFYDLLMEGEAFSIKKDTIFISVPVKENNVVIGRLGVASSSKPIAAVKENSIKAVAYITIGMLLLGLPFIMMLLNRKLKPIAVITDNLKRISFDNIQLDIPIKEKNELGYLAETLKVMGSKLNLAQKEIIEQERISRELEIASEIQANILPRFYPTGSNFEFAGSYYSAKEVGGDYYDFIDYDSENIGFLVADVSGKSLPGMLVMLLTRDIVRNLSRYQREPAELLTEVNRELLSNIKKGMFVTMFYGLLNKKSGQFKFASAGHNPLILLDVQSGKTNLFKTKGFPLGMMAPDKFEARIEAGEIFLNDNSWLIQYTDGVNEALNKENEEFGMDRFIELLKHSKELNPQELISSTIDGLKEYTKEAIQYDDITLLAVKWSKTTVDKDNILRNSLTNAD